MRLPPVSILSKLVEREHGSWEYAEETARGGEGWFFGSLGRYQKGEAVPHDDLTDLPDGGRNNLPYHAQGIYEGAFNSAGDRYGEGGRAHAVAWSRSRERRLGGEEGLA